MSWIIGKSWGRSINDDWQLLRFLFWAWHIDDTLQGGKLKEQELWSTLLRSAMCMKWAVACMEREWHFLAFSWRFMALLLCFHTTQLWKHHTDLWYCCAGNTASLQHFGAICQILCPSAAQNRPNVSGLGKVKWSRCVVIETYKTDRQWREQKQRNWCESTPILLQDIFVAVKVSCFVCDSKSD